MPLTPADVRNKQFSTTRLRPGYDEEEVDAFLDEVEARYGGTRQGRQELDGELFEDVEGTLWKPALIERGKSLATPREKGRTA